MGVLGAGVDLYARIGQRPESYMPGPGTAYEIAGVAWDGVQGAIDALPNGQKSPRDISAQS